MKMDISRARVIYLLTTDRQPVIFWATNTLCARLFYDSNTDICSFPSLHEQKSHKNVYCYRGIYMYFVSFLMRENDVTPSVLEMKLT